MITCRDDALVFDAAEVNAEMESHADRHVERWRPAVCAAGWESCLDRLLAKDFDWLLAKHRAATRSALVKGGDGGLARRFRRMVRKQLDQCAASVEIRFQRTLRLPDDGKAYPLPPGLGVFPLRRIELYGERVPRGWRSQGGVLMPIYQAEALWLRFGTRYPFALKVATGLVNAVNGKPWQKGLTPTPQDYVVLPEQPWLDGYCVGAGTTRQFVAARLGDGYTAEEQLHGTAIGGLQLEAFPLKTEVFFRKQFKDVLPRTSEAVLRDAIFRELGRAGRLPTPRSCAMALAESSGMGLGAGGAMKQMIYRDPWEPEDWDLSRPLRVWVHLCDAVRWVEITGELPPQEPVTARDYANHRLPWFDYYRDDMAALEGSGKLASLQTVFEMARKRRDASVPQEESVTPGPRIALGPHVPANAVAEWDGA